MTQWLQNKSKALRRKEIELNSKVNKRRCRRERIKELSEEELTRDIGVWLHYKYLFFLEKELEWKEEPLQEIRWTTEEIMEEDILDE